VNQTVAAIGLLPGHPVSAVCGSAERFCSMGVGTADTPGRRRLTYRAGSRSATLKALIPIEILFIQPVICTATILSQLLMKVPACGERPPLRDDSFVKRIFKIL
jgi:hypothetical protein